MNFWLNRGYLYERPYESQYAQVRRFLVANYGTPYHTLMKELKGQTPSLKSYTNNTVDRLDIISITNSPFVHRNSPKTVRACPECAMRLYHTDIYNYPWLTHCPIHHCPILERCPQCHKPWPAHREVHQRTCTLCGITSVTQLLENDFNPIPGKDFDIIKRLYRFVTSDLPEYYLTFSFETGSNWENIPEHDASFPSLRVNSQSEFTSAELKSLEIPLLRVHTKHTQLSEYEYIPEYKYLMANFDWMPEIRRKAINEICHKLLKASPGHKLSLSDYRGVSLTKKSNRKFPCPYCLALSLWFINSHIGLHGEIEFFSNIEYLFLKQLGYLSLYKPGPKVYLATHDDAYTTSRDFQKWSYHRDLTISFLEILNLCLQLHDNLDTFRIIDSYLVTANKEIFSMHRKPYDQQLFYKSGNDLIFSYRYPSQLDSLKNINRKYLKRTCSDFRKILNEEKTEHVYFFDIKLRNIPISPAEYEIHTKALLKTYCYL